MAFIVGVFVRLTDPSSPSLLFLWENKLSVPGCGRFSFHVSVQCCIVGEAGGPAAGRLSRCLSRCVAYTLFEAQVLDPSAHPSLPPALSRIASSKTIPNVHEYLQEDNIIFSRHSEEKCVLAINCIQLLVTLSKASVILRDSYGSPLRH